MDNPPDPAGCLPRTAVLAWMIISQIIAVLFLLPWFAAFAFASMIGFPEVVIEQNDFNFNALLFTGLLCYPLFALAPVILAWVIFAAKKNDEAALLTTLPILFFLLIAACWWFTLPTM